MYFKVPLVDVEGGALPITLLASVNINTPMQTEEQLATCNVLSIVVDGMFAIPETWSVVQPGKYSFTCMCISLLF